MSPGFEKVLNKPSDHQVTANREGLRRPPSGALEWASMKLKHLLLVGIVAWATAGAPMARPTSTTLDQLKARAQSKRLERAEHYLKSVRAVTPILEKQGGLVLVPADLPTVLLPDLHAQRDYLVQALEMRVDGKTVFERLSQGKLVLVCMGDGMHSEERNLQQWLQAEREITNGSGESPAMEKEMVESLGLLTMVMDLKVAFPNHFYFVRGNHEDMDPQRPYRKFTSAGESNLVKKWVIHHYGQDFLKDWHHFECLLPLVAIGGSFVASHSPPGLAITKESVQAREDQAFRSCTWSDNPNWAEGGAEQKAFEENCLRFGVDAKRPWLCGHRKVEGALFRSQCGGKVIQINPLCTDARVVIVAPPRGKAFQPAVNVRKLP